MKILVLNKDSSALWDSFILGSSQGWFFHLSEWIRIIEDVLGQINLSFMILRQEEILAAVSLVKEKGPFFSKLVLPPFSQIGSFVLRDGLDSGEAMAVIDKIIKNIDYLAQKHRATYFQFSDLLFARNHYVPYSKLSLSQEHGDCCIYEERKLRFIDLSKDEPVLWKDVKRNAKIDIKIGNRNSLSLSQGFEVDGVQNFYYMLKKIFKKTGAKIIPREFYTQLWRYFSQKGLVKLFLVDYQHIKIAAAMIICFKGTAFYLAGSSDAKYIKLRPNHLLQWKIILWLKRNGYNRYILGINNPKTRKRKESCIDFFESRFGGETFNFRSVKKVYRLFSFKILSGLLRLKRYSVPNR